MCDRLLHSLGVICDASGASFRVAPAKSKGLQATLHDAWAGVASRFLS